MEDYPCIGHWGDSRRPRQPLMRAWHRVHDNGYSRFISSVFFFDISLILCFTILSFACCAPIDSVRYACSDFPKGPHIFVFIAGGATGSEVGLVRWIHSSKGLRKVVSALFYFWFLLDFISYKMLSESCSAPGLPQAYDQAEEASCSRILESRRSCDVYNS